MFHEHLDSFHYVRPICYQSYYKRQQKPLILTQNDPDTQEVSHFLQQQGVDFIDQGGLSRGFKIGDAEIGRRVYNHNVNCPKVEYYIHQWKPTNKMENVYPTGEHYITKSFPQFMNRLQAFLNHKKA